MFDASGSALHGNSRRHAYEVLQKLHEQRVLADDIVITAVGKACRVAAGVLLWTTLSTLLLCPSIPGGGAAAQIC